MVTCFCYGIIGLILGIVALVLAHKDLKLYRENPEIYLNYNSLTIGRILAILGITLSIISTIFFAYLISLGEEGMKDFQQNLLEKAKQQQEMNE